MKIVMIDQDGVVCDRSYKITKNISKTIKAINEKKIIIVPNSDTPIERLKNNFQTFLNLKTEIIIGEKGATLEVFGSNIATFNILGIEEYKISLISKFKEKGAIVYTGDSASWVKDRKRFLPESKIILLDEQRKQTVGLYAFGTDYKGDMFFNSDWFYKISSLIKEIPKPCGLSDFDINEKYGIMITNVEGASKTDGFKVIKEYFPESIFFMIGNSQDDIIKNEKVIHCAVANAKQELKDIASFTSSFSFTEGLEECLKWIFNYQKSPS